MHIDDEREELDGLDDYDRARAADMEERPIYMTINVTVQVVLVQEEAPAPCKEEAA